MYKSSLYVCFNGMSKATISAFYALLCLLIVRLTACTFHCHVTDASQ